MENEYLYLASTFVFGQLTWLCIDCILQMTRNHQSFDQESRSMLSQKTQNLMKGRVYPQMQNFRSLMKKYVPEPLNRTNPFEYMY